MSVQRRSSPSPEMPANGARAHSTPQRPDVFLPSVVPRSLNGTVGGSSVPHTFRRSQRDHGSALQPPNSRPSLAAPPPAAAAAAVAAGGLAHLAPHSPAVARASKGASPRQFSASMRGTSAAQRMHTVKYATRYTNSAVPTTVNHTHVTTSSAYGQQPDTSFTSVPPRPSPADGPLYYVVGNAVVNPQLTVSPSVQSEIRGVASLAAPPDSMRRPGIGPQLHNTHTAISTNNTGVAATSFSKGTAAHPTAHTRNSARNSPPRDDDDENADSVVCVEGIRSTRATTKDIALPYAHHPRGMRCGLLVGLRQLYGTTADDVIEVAQTNPRSGMLEPPRMQYHTVQELLPELASNETQLKALANARRRIDWDVSIPTAATLPPPAITFTTANGAPVLTLSSVYFTVDTNTLVMQRDYAAEKAMSRTNTSHVAVFGEVRGLAVTAATLNTTTPVTTAISASNNTVVASRTTGSKTPLFQEEEAVGLDITREDRIGSSGLYRIRHLVGLRQGLGEMVGLNRVLEYEVTTTSSKLFMEQPSIDASSGDLLMELNTSLQGTTKLIITGVDCGSVDAETGEVQRSSNTLVCYISLNHNTTASMSAAALRGRNMVAMSVCSNPPYACVPSASARMFNTNHDNALNSSTRGGMPVDSINRNRDNAANESPIGSDGFSLSLAHFNQEFGAADRSGSRNLSLQRDAIDSGGTAGGGGDHDNAAGVSGSHRHSLDVQGVVARTAAFAEVGTSAPLAGTGHGSSLSGTGRRPCSSVSSGDAGGGYRSDSHYLFTFTNPHDLRYRHYTEAIRISRLQQYAQQQERERQEAQKCRKGQEAASPKSVSNPPGTATSNNNNNNNNNTNSSNGNSNGTRHNPNNNLNSDSWSDDNNEKDVRKEPLEEGLSRGQESASTTTATPNSAMPSTASAATSENKRTQRKSIVEILMLEDEFDLNNPVAIPTVADMLSQGSAPSSASVATRRAQSAQRLHDEPFNNTPGGVENGTAIMVPRELRRPHLPSTLFCMNSLQLPVSYLRLTAWQDRLLLLFTEEDKELLRSDQRARFKREARLELTEGSLSGILSSTFAWCTNPNTGNGGHRLSMQGRRSSSVANTRSPSNAGNGPGNGGNNGDEGNGVAAFSAITNKSNGINQLTSGNSSSGTGVFSEKPFTLIRSLILCLALEEERSSVQLYADVVQLCSYLSHSALLKTMTLTRGTRDGLQQAAAAILASGSPETSLKGAKGGMNAPPVWEGNSSLSASERESLRVLSDTLELSLTVSLLIGAYGNAAEYAVQRVHALCLLEGDTTSVVNAAQRDLAEAYLFYGDYATAVKIAEDVVMLSEQLSASAPGAYDVAEAENLCALACIAAGRRDRLAHYIARLEMNVMPMEEGPNSATTSSQPLLQAQLRLVLCFAKMYIAHANGGMAGEDVLALLREAVRLLRGDGDLQEMEQSFSTVLLGQGRRMTNFDSSNTNAPLPVRSRLTSMTTGNLTAVPSSTGRAVTDIRNGNATMKQMMAAQKRLRWNLLSFAGILLVDNDQTEEGIEVMESTVKELVLGQHRYVERTHRSSIAAILWVSLVLTKSWAQPASKEDYATMLKEVASRAVRIKGPLHPIAAAANLQYANVVHHSLNGRHGLGLVARSLSVLESAVSPQSNYLLMAHYVLGSMAESQQRWRPALEHLSAAYAIAQASHVCEPDLLQLDTRFLGALLNCPVTVIVDVDTTALYNHIERRLKKVCQFAGPHSEALVDPLWNMAEVHYLLKQPKNAVECLQQAVRLLDRRGVLFASVHLLRPIDALRLEHMRQEAQRQQQRDSSGVETKDVQQLIEQRNAVVHTSFDSVSQALRLANTLYMLGAVFESQARTTEAQQKYEQCLAIFEALQLGTDSLPAARVMMTIAKLLYTTANCSDALRWANRAESLLHIHYRKQWPLELESAKKLVAIVERRLNEEEGTYVVQSDIASQDGLKQLL